MEGVKRRGKKKIVWNRGALMRAKKWIILLFYLYLFFSFSYLCYNQWMNGYIIISIIWGMCALSLGYKVIRFLREKKKDGWNRSYVVLD